MSNLKESNIWTMEEVHKKNYIMRFTDIDVNFDATYEGHQNCSKILSMNILRVFQILVCSPLCWLPWPPPCTGESGVGLSDVTHICNEAITSWPRRENPWWPYWHQFGLSNSNIRAIWPHFKLSFLQSIHHIRVQLILQCQPPASPRNIEIPPTPVVAHHVWHPGHDKNFIM